jgi:hypothetical protein
MCSICGEESTRICARCTKDACDNHLCEKCLRCSDCCECEVTLSDVGRGVSAGSARAVIRAAGADSSPVPASDPEPPHPPPDPDPAPEDEPYPGPVGP